MRDTYCTKDIVYGYRVHNTHNCTRGTAFDVAKQAASRPFGVTSAAVATMASMHRAVGCQGPGAFERLMSIYHMAYSYVGEVLEWRCAY